MRLLAPHQTPPAIVGGQFRQGRFGASFFALVMAGATGTAFYLGSISDAGWFLFPFGAFLGLIALLVFGAAKATWKETNWNLRCANDGLYIKIRSYMNHHFSEQDAIVAFVPYREIESARVLREKLIVPGSEEGLTRETSKVDLELRLRHQDTQELAQTIEMEKTRIPPGKIRSWTPHRPVEVLEPGVILVHWRDANSHLVPRIERFLEATRGRFTLEKETPAPTIDFRQMNDAELEALALKLARAGQRLEAMSLLHQKFGGTLTDAKQRLERISGKLS